MNCETALIKIPEVLKMDTSVRDAIAILFESDRKTLPVVDENDVYQGLFGGHQVLEKLLPQSFTMVGGLPDASFMHDKPSDLVPHLDKILDKPIADFVDRDGPVAKCSTPLVETLLLLYKHRTIVPVVNEEGKLLGQVSVWSVLSEIMKYK